MLIKTNQAIADLSKLKQMLSRDEIVNAEKMAINDAVRFGKTKVKQSILELYNFKPSRVTDPAKDKGLSIKPATGSNVEAHIRAGHTPANLGSFKKTRFTRKGLEIEVNKGNPQRIPSAFRLYVSKGQKGAAATGDKAIAFARGRYGKPTFQWGKSRKPIATLTSLSVATAALNVKAQERYGTVIQQKYEQRVVHHLKRLISAL